MAITDLLPRRRNQEQTAIQRCNQDPLATLQQEMNRLFDEVFTRPLDMLTFGGQETSFIPSLDVFESDSEVIVTAEVPGRDEKDIQVSVTRNMLTISGEKVTEREEKKGQYHRMERARGSLRREVLLPCDVASDKAEAVFSQGVLKVTLPKPPELVRKTKRIAVKKA